MPMTTTGAGVPALATPANAALWPDGSFAVWPDAQHVTFPEIV